MNPRMIAAAGAVVALCACGTGAERSPAAAASTVSDAKQQTGGAVGLVPTAASIPEGCDLIPRAEVERLAGALQGEPKREGRGCWYYVAMDTTNAEWKQVRAGAERARAAGMDARAIEMYHPTRAGMYLETDVRGEGQAQERSGPDTGNASATGTNPAGQSPAPPAGWDEVRLSPRGTSFYGRAGHVRVTVRLQQLRLQSDTLIAIANRLRDRIPEGPIPHPAADRSGRAAPGPDPCSVLTRDEAEVELGELVAAPFRTREHTPLADPAGRSCAYLAAKHRVLVLTPTWHYGRIELRASRMAGGLVRQVADLPGIEGDTLEGPWDEAVVDLAGELLLLKGANSLGIRYQMSSTNAAGAIRLAGPALRRLAAAP